MANRRLHCKHTVSFSILIFYPILLLTVQDSHLDCFKTTFKNELLFSLARIFIVWYVRDTKRWFFFWSRYRIVYAYVFFWYRTIRWSLWRTISSWTWSLESWMWAKMPRTRTTITLLLSNDRYSRSRRFDLLRTSYKQYVYKKYRRDNQYLVILTHTITRSYISSVFVTIQELAATFKRHRVEQRAAS